MVATPRVDALPPTPGPGATVFQARLAIPFHEERVLRERKEYLLLLKNVKLQEIAAAEARAAARAERKRARDARDRRQRGPAVAVRAKLELAPLLGEDGAVLFGQDEDGALRLPELRPAPPEPTATFLRRLPRALTSQEDEVHEREFRQVEHFAKTEGISLDQVRDLEHGLVGVPLPRGSSFDKSRRRRGRVDLGSPRRRSAATPRPC